MVRFLIRGAGLLALSLALSALLALSAFERLHERATISTFASVVKLLRQDLSGVPTGAHGRWREAELEAGLERTALRLREHLEEATGSRPSRASLAVSLAFTDGVIAHSTDSTLVGSRLPPRSRLKSLDRQGPNIGLEDVRYIRSEWAYAITLPLPRHGPESEATAVISLDARLIEGDPNARQRILVRSAGIGFLTGAAVLLGLLLWPQLSPARASDPRHERARAAWVLGLAVGIAQLVAFSLDAAAVRADYLEVLERKMVLATALAGETLEEEGVQASDLDGPGARRVLRGYLEAFGEIESLALLDAGGREVSRMAGPAIEPEATRGEPAYRFEVTGPGGIQGYIETAVSSRIIWRQMVSMVIDAFTVVAVSLLLCMELVILALTRLDAEPMRSGGPAQSSPPATGREPDYKPMRPAIFMFLFGIDISMSFLPLHMERLYEPMFGLSRDVVIALPVSVEFMCVGIAILCAGMWLDRRGWREPFLYGLLLATVGGLYSWLAPDAAHFVASRAVVGFGYGLTLLAAQGFVIRRTDMRSKARGLAHLFAGLYAGSLCGAATGSMMAERFGYEAVFLTGSFLVLAVLIYALMYLGPATTGHDAVSGEDGRADPAPPGAVRRFLLDRRVLAAVFFSSMPAAVAVVGFLNYFSPIYLNRVGATDSTIGQVLMLFGICLTLAGPRIGRFVDASPTKELPIFIGSVLGGVAFLTFNLLDGVHAAMVAVVLLGLSSSMVLSAQSAYVLGLDVTRELGDGKAMGIFRSTSRIGQMLGPVIFGWLIVGTDIRDGVTYFGMAYLATSVAFLFLAGRAPRTVVERTV